jgi:hypothetical protein
VAFGNTTNGDTILLAPGIYHPSASLEVFRSVTISGEPGKAAPLIEAGGSRGLFMQNPSSTVRDLRIHSLAGTSVGLLMIGAGSVAERMESTGEATEGACVIGAATIRDSLCAAVLPGNGGLGLFLFNSTPSPTTEQADAFNVTAIGGAEGIAVVANEKASVRLDATNTIASGGVKDVVARSFVTTAPVTINLSHSNFETFEEEGGEAEITSPTVAGNQSAAPLFVNAAPGDYRELEGSPTRLAGDLGVVLPGELDLAGGSRTTNCAGTAGVDIGAYQFECLTLDESVIPPLIPVAPVTFTPNAPTTKSRATAPSLSKLALKPAKFEVTGKAKKGTTISFTLSMAASVKLEVLGKKTVKGKKPKIVTLGSLASIQGRSGANSVRFNGKVKGKPLAPGNYTLRATATGAGGSSVPVKSGFEVLIP